MTEQVFKPKEENDAPTPEQIGELAKELYTDGDFYEVPEAG